MKSDKKSIVEKECPRCKHKFHCDIAEGCWCEKPFLTKDILAYLRTKYVDCLCPDCLEFFAASKN